MNKNPFFIEGDDKHTWMDAETINARIVRPLNAFLAMAAKDPLKLIKTDAGCLLYDKRAPGADQIDTGGDVVISGLQIDDTVTAILAVTGAVFIGGYFTTIDGMTRPSLAKISTGAGLAIDATFNAGAGLDPEPGETENVAALLVSASNIFAAGSFDAFNSTTGKGGVVRFSNAGAIDATFNGGTGTADNTDPGAIEGAAVQTSGKILIAGNFTEYNGTARENFARLNSDGSLDSLELDHLTHVPDFFDPLIYTTEQTRFNAVVALSSGKILTGGQVFQRFNAVTENYDQFTGIARFNSDGTIDSGFNFFAGGIGSVNAIGVLSSGKIAIGGQLDLGLGVALLNSNGTEDAGFTSPVTGGTVFAIVIDAADKITILGRFLLSGGSTPYGAARLTTSGTVELLYPAFPDLDFPTDPDHAYCATIQGANILIGGRFREWQEMDHLARFDTTTGAAVP